MRSSKTRLRLAARAALVALGAGVSLRFRPAIELRPLAVEAHEEPAELIARMRSSLASGDNVLVTGADALVARFAGRAGPFRYRTVELVTFARDEVRFEHLGGTFDSCHERFAFRRVEGGATRIEHGGAFTIRGGLLGWLVGMLVVRGLFEAHVAAHLRAFATGEDPVS